MRIASINRFFQLVNNVLGRRLIGVAHPEINDVFTSGASRLLQFPNDIEDIGREAFDTLKRLVHYYSLVILLSLYGAYSTPIICARSAAGR